MEMMSMDDMVSALASMDEKQRKMMMAERLETFVGMREDERRSAMEMMLQAVSNLSQSNARKVVKTRTIILCELPDVKRNTLMGSHMAVLKKLGGATMMTEMKLVESVIPELSSGQQRMMQEMMKMMKMPGMDMGGGGAKSMGARSRTATAKSSNWGYATVWITALVGAAVLLSPFVFGYTGDLVATWNDVIFGAGIAIIAGAVAIAKLNLAYSSRSLTFMWIATLAGIWLIIAPFVLTYQGSGTTVINIVLGIAATILAGAVAIGRPNLV